MNSEWIDEYCLEKKGVTKDYQSEWEAVRYFIGEKMFAMQGEDKQGRSIFTMKLEPEFGDFMRQQFEDVVPGYYMNKVHWNSVYLEGTLPEDTLRNMIDKSYEAGFCALTKKKQREVLEEG